MRGDNVTPRKAPNRPIDPWVDYDEVADTLLMYFFGAPEPAVSYKVHGDSHLYLRLSLEKYEIIGVQIEAFVTSFLRENPQFMELARTAGISEDTLRRIEEDLDKNEADRLRRRSIARILKTELEDREIVTAD